MRDTISGPLRIHLFGAFCVTGPDGADRTPTSAKGQALLALLVTSRSHKRTRSWVQDKLWSRSDPGHGAANLRQVLAKVRRALGPWAHLVGSDRRAVWLESDLFTSDWPDQPAGDIASFLEGIDIDDPEFATWLAGVRNAVAGNPPAAPGARRPGPGRWRVALNGADPAFGPAAFLEAEVLSMLSNGLRETGLVEIGATANDPLDPLALDLSIAVSPVGEGRLGLRLSVLRPERRRILWSTTKVIAVAQVGIDAPLPLIELVAAAQAAILREIARETDPPPGLGDETLALGKAAQQVFSFDIGTLERTDRSLAALQDGRDRGVVLGLRAQVAVIRDIERLTDAPEANAEQGLLFAARGLEVDPVNSLVLASAANAQVFLNWDIETGADLAAMALRANRANPLAWWARANAALYAGATDQALECAHTAARLAQGTALQFWCQFQLGLAALAAHQPELARRSLETSAAIAPFFRPPRRYLLALYTKLGRRDRAVRMARDLAALEPGFTLDAFARDPDYPVSLARRLGLIDPAALCDLDGV